jgi:serine/threonine protein phosphatase PrpC
MQWEQKVEFAALSDIGVRRQNNQDSFALQTASDRAEWDRRGHLFLVADGMGGHAVGELASKLAADTVPHTYLKSAGDDPAAALRDAVSEAHRIIHERGQHNRDFTRMGTTCTALALCSQGAIVAHVGDSRCYRVRGQRIEQLTFDHSLQWEMMRQGRMTAEEVLLIEPRRNVITRSLGPEPTVQIDIEGPYPVRPKDVYVLCSDGLSGQVSDEEIGIIAGELPPAQACRLLVDLANLRGGTDNITVVIARVGALPEGVDPLPPEAPPRQESPYGWGWLVAAAVVTLALLGGFALALVGRPMEAIYIEALAVMGLGALVLAALRLRKKTETFTLPKITAGMPYRTASAKITSAFLTSITATESAIQQTAHDEGWSVDWQEHDATYKAAKAALTDRKYSLSLRHYARAIQILMEPMRQQRKQREFPSKWGAKSSPNKG